MKETGYDSDSDNDYFDKDQQKTKLVIDNTDVNVNRLIGAK